MKNEDDDRTSRTSATSNQSALKPKKHLSTSSIRKADSMKHLSNQSIIISRSSLSSSVRRLENLGGGRRGQRRLSRIQENVAVITSCEKDPDVCVLCGSGIPSSKCVSCDSQAHNKCITAFFCTLDKKVNLSTWKCPKCVTMLSLKDGEKAENKFTIVNEEEPVVKPPEPECPFCKIDMDFKNCQCEECMEGLEGVSKLKKCTCDQPQLMRYNKCLHCREFGAVCRYKSLREDGKEMGDEKTFGTRIISSVMWCILLLTLAFPIAMVSAYIFIFVYCFESCFDVSYDVSNSLMKGIKLPGTCSRGIWSGTKMF